MRNITLPLVIITCLASFTSFSARTIEAHAQIVLSDINVVDVKKGEVQFNKDVVITNNKITAIRPHSPSANEAKGTIRSHGKYLLPGLWDMHTHIRSYTAQDNLPMFIANGITGIRDLGITNHELIKQWKQQINAHELIGPRVVSSAVIIEGASPRFPSSLSISRADQVKPEIDKLVAQGAEIIKLFQNIPADVFTQIVNYAHEKGLKTSGHTPTGWSQIQAADIKLDSIEHLFGISNTFQAYDTYKFSEAEMDRLAHVLKQNNTFQSPTIVGYKYREKLYRVALDPTKNDATFEHAEEYKYTPAYFKAWWKGIKDRALTNIDISEFENQQKQFKFHQTILTELSQHGVKMLAGTDTPNPYLVLGSSLHDELLLYVESGMSTLEALRSATLYPGEYFGKEALIGQVKVGSYADLVILNHNPLDDIRHTRSIDKVITNGHIYNHKDLSKIKERQLVLLANLSPRDFDQYIYMDVRRNGLKAVQEKYPMLNKPIKGGGVATQDYDVNPEHLLRLSKSLDSGLQKKQAKLALEWNSLMFPNHQATQDALKALQK
jgi:hypothetical protein